MHMHKYFLIILRVCEQEQDNIQLGRSSFQLVNYSTNRPSLSTQPNGGKVVVAALRPARCSHERLVSALSSPSPRTSNKWRHCDMVTAKLLIFSIFIATCLAQYEGKV